MISFFLAIAWLVLSCLIMISSMERSKAVALNAFLWVIVLISLFFVDPENLLSFLCLLLGYVIPLVTFDFKSGLLSKETKKRLKGLSPEDRLQEREETYQKINDLLSCDFLNDCKKEELKRLQSIKAYLDKIC